MTANRLFFPGYFGFIKARIDTFAEFVFEVESKFEEDLRSKNEEFDELVGEARGTEIEANVADYLADDYRKIESHFPQHLRYSAIVSIYSLLEDSMNSICRFLTTQRNLPLELNDLNDKGIFRAQKYLTKVCGIDFPETSREWNEIRKLNKVRNCIVHTNGNASKIEEMARQTRGIALETGRPYLIIEREYIANATDWISSLLEDIFKKVFET